MSSLSRPVSEGRPTTAAGALLERAALRPAIGLGLASLLVLGLAYAVGTTAVTRPLFPAQADGSLLVIDGQVRGSRLVAQPFAGDGYFQTRPSAASYDPMAAAGSNLSRSNPALQTRVHAATQAVATREGVPASAVPSDLVTQSGAGLDPELSPQAMALQVARVARSRGLSTAQVDAVVKAHTQGPQWGVFGQTRVNVMEVNVALDALQRAPQPVPGGMP